MAAPKAVTQSSSDSRHPLGSTQAARSFATVSRTEVSVCTLPQLPLTRSSLPSSSVRMFAANKSLVLFATRVAAGLAQPGASSRLARFFRSFLQQIFDLHPSTNKQHQQQQINHGSTSSKRKAGGQCSEGKQRASEPARPERESRWDRESASNAFFVSRGDCSLVCLFVCFAVCAGGGGFEVSRQHAVQHWQPEEAGLSRMGRLCGRPLYVDWGCIVASARLLLLCVACFVRR